MKLLLILLLITSNILTQVRLKRGNDLIFKNHSYRVVNVPTITENGYPDSWKLWMADDLVPYTKSHIMDMETQSNQKGVGIFLNGAYDSLKINYEGAIKACPTGWRLPRIGEWDTLLNTLSYSQRMNFFNKLKGFKGVKTYSVNDSIFKTETSLPGGFYWSSTEDSSGHKSWGVEIESNYNINVGKADKSDFLSVRCVKDETYDD